MCNIHLWCLFHSRESVENDQMIRRLVDGFLIMVQFVEEVLVNFVEDITYGSEANNATHILFKKSISCFDKFLFVYFLSLKSNISLFIRLKKSCTIN